MNLITKEQLLSYNEKGFLKLENFFSNHEVQEILEASRNCQKNSEGIEIIYEEDGETLRSMMSYHDKNEVLDQFTRDSQILDVVKAITKSDVYVSQSKINKKKPTKGKKWDLHRGYTFWNTLDGMPNTSMISVFIFLTDQTIENGAVYALTGSHKNITKDVIVEESNIQGGRTRDTAANLSIQIKQENIDKYFEDHQQEYLTGKAGDVLLMHSCLLHASYDNKTNDSRDLMITVYNPIDNLPTKHDRPAYLCEPFSEAIAPFDRALKVNSLT